MDDREQKVNACLDSFVIEIPSWGFANTGTRFGKYLQLGAATNLEEKFADAAQIHALTGVTPTLALHVQWDLPEGLSEIYTHPATGPYRGSAPGYQYAGELAALTDPAVAASLAAQGIKTGGFSDFSS